MAAENDIINNAISSSGISSVTFADVQTYLGSNVDSINQISDSFKSINDKLNSPLSSSDSPSLNANGSNIAPTDKKGKETNPPTAPSDLPNSVVKSGEPTVPGRARGVATKNGISKGNDDLVHICDFTIMLELEVCGENFKKILVNETLRAESLGAWAASVEIPFLDDIRNMYNTLKAWYDMIKSYIDEIKEWINCLKSIMQAIQKVMSFIVNLPGSVLSQVMNCIAGYEKLFLDAVNSTVDAIKVDIESKTATDAVNEKLDSQKTSLDSAKEQFSELLTS